MVYTRTFHGIFTISTIRLSKNLLVLEGCRLKIFGTARKLKSAPGKTENKATYCVMSCSLLITQCKGN